MMTSAESNRPGNGDGLLLPGLDGTNPLGFLAALGVLRAISMGNGEARMAWTPVMGGWRPRVRWSPQGGGADLRDFLLATLNFGSPDPTEEMRTLHADYLSSNNEATRERWLQACFPALLIGDNTNVRADEFRARLDVAIEGADRSQHCKLDSYAALGIEVPDESGVMQDTALRTMSGAGHQHFLRFAANLLAQVREGHLEKALLEEWTYDDPVRNLTLRLDPIEDARYGLRWGNPSKDPSRKGSGSVLGANALGVLGLTVLSTVPTHRGARTVARTIGFRGHGARNTYWRWPIWSAFLSLEVVQSLLCVSALMGSLEGDAALLQRGVSAVFESRRLTVGKYRNFTPARRIA